jgi:hypothetical protein
MTKQNTNTAYYKSLQSDMVRALRTLNEQFYACEPCEESGTEPGTDHDACRICGGYGFNPGGDIREAILEARVVLGKLGDVRPFQGSKSGASTPSQDRTSKATA